MQIDISLVCLSVTVICVRLDADLTVELDVETARNLHRCWRTTQQHRSSPQSNKCLYHCSLNSVITLVVISAKKYICTMDQELA